MCVLLTMQKQEEDMLQRPLGNMQIQMLIFLW